LQWTCGGCTLLNNDCRNRCEVCGARKTQDEQREKQHPILQQKQPEKQQQRETQLSLPSKTNLLSKQSKLDMFFKKKDQDDSNDEILFKPKLEKSDDGDSDNDVINENGDTCINNATYCDEDTTENLI
jgi:hypothetical protein